VQELQEKLDSKSTSSSFPKEEKGKEEEEEDTKKNDWAVLTNQLHQTTTYLHTLESTNAKLTAELAVLRDRHSSVEVLKEERRGLETKLKGMEEMRKRAVMLEAEVERYVLLLRRFDDDRLLTDDGAGIKSPSPNPPPIPAPPPRTQPPSPPSVLPTPNSSNNTALPNPPSPPSPTQTLPFLTP
jgi:hypothetical protein